MPSIIRTIGAAVVLLAGVTSASAQISINLVPVGYAGNAADPVNTPSIPGIGAVAYAYQIGTYEVTNTQYAGFLNAVAASDPYTLYNPQMASDNRVGGINRSGSDGSYAYTVKSGYENRPVGFVSFWDAARFSNWLHNGQGSGSTETGAYTLNGVAVPTGSVTRNGGAQWFVPSISEWYKAAYYDPTKGGVGGYWAQATRSDTLGGNQNFSLSNGANYFLNSGNDNTNFAIWTFWINGINGVAVTPGGTYVNASSYFGTYDQAGNLFELTDTEYPTNYRWYTGGAWNEVAESGQSGYWGLAASTEESDFYYMGFRVASAAAIPEPAWYTALAGLGALGLALRRSRKAA